ncbi:nitroreductase family protein [Peribacillus butanolivorans]|uniref:nitroreductase family protein n=1 Tax=Peribacillus butanolivorans TaxID=421767 RepID=UPI0035DCD0A9
MYNRRSVRYFMDKQIDQETLIEIVKDAQMTPSWANSQPWRVYIATDETRRLNKFKKLIWHMRSKEFEGMQIFQRCIVRIGI